MYEYSLRLNNDVSFLDVSQRDHICLTEVELCGHGKNKKNASATHTLLLCLLCANIQGSVLYSHEYLQKVLFKITCSCTFSWGTINSLICSVSGIFYIG